MNLIIQELAEQAGFYVADGRIYIPSTSEEITTCQKKFAELIVAECLEIAIEEEQHAPFEGPVETKIRQHFGVEE